MKEWKVERDGSSIGMLIHWNRVFRLQTLGERLASDMWGAPADNDELLESIAKAMNQSEMIKAMQAQLVEQMRIQTDIELSLRREIGAMQAHIDRLMLEYCPEDMTKEQLERWAAHQRPASKEEGKS